MIDEKDVESYRWDKAKSYGGLALKWVCPSWSGVPDRIVLLPKGKIGFIELKTQGKKPRPQQQRWLERLRELGFIAEWADTKADVDCFLQILEEGHKE